MFTLFMICAMSVYAQEVEMVSVPKSQLTSQQLAEIEANVQLDKIQNYGKWVGVGDEIGVAVREGLMGVVDVADKFGSTDVGKFTMYMIAWKIIGKDAIRILLGLLFYFIITFLFIKIYNNTYRPKRVLVEDLGLFKYPKKYEVVKPERWEGYELMKFVMLFLYAGAIGITYSIMFS